MAEAFVLTCWVHARGTETDEQKDRWETEVLMNRQQDEEKEKKRRERRGGE
jgi:hypothetical protein